MMSGETPDVADITEILRLLPHRYPFLLIDRVIDIRGEDHGIGIKKLHDERAAIWTLCGKSGHAGCAGDARRHIDVHVPFFQQKDHRRGQRRPAQAAQRGLSGVVRHNRIMASTRIAETDRRPPMGLVKRHYVVAVFPPAGRALP